MHTPSKRIIDYCDSSDCGYSILVKGEEGVLYKRHETKKYHIEVCGMDNNKRTNNLVYTINLYDDRMGVGVPSLVKSITDISLDSIDATVRAILKSV